MKIQSLIIIALTISTQSLFANIITIKQDGTGNYQTIQQGINAAGNGDTVLVWPGTYFENIDFSGKDIAVASLFLPTQEDSYIQSTIIDGNQNGSCVSIVSGEGQGALLCGFTIQNGSGNGSGYWIKGGGIQIDGADPEIRNCIVQYNDANMGGGICIDGSNTHVNNCLVQNNTALAAGGIYSRTYANTFLSGVTVKNNFARLSGGGISCSFLSSTIFDSINRCNIYMNYAAYGSDYIKTSDTPPQQIYLDTFTVANPDQHFIYSLDDDNFPVDDLDIDILHGKVTPVEHDLYINPMTGNDDNDGLSPQSPLKTIAYAYNVIASDSIGHYNILLSSGVYAPSTNGEKFPLNGRSHVSLIGAEPDSTVFDADSIYYFFKAYGLMHDFMLRNIGFINGFGNYSALSSAGLFIENCFDATFDNLIIENCISTSYPGIYSGTNDNISFSNITLQNNQGGYSISTWNKVDPPKTFSMENIIIRGNGPDSNPEVGYGGGMGIFGKFSVPGLFKGRITNLQITDNLFYPLDTAWTGPVSIAALGIVDHVIIDMVNATIGDNIARNKIGFAIGIAEGIELNIYNSIFYGDSILELQLGSMQGITYPSTANIAYSDIEHGEDSIINWYGQNTLNWLDGNINDDPLWDTASATPYALPWNSPCVDAGTPMYEFGMEPPFIILEDSVFSLVTLEYADTIPLPATDLAGNPRIVNGRIDMGAYEFQDTATQIAEQYLQKIKGTEMNVWPNPFTYNAFISFALSQKSDVKVIVRDMQGRQTRMLMDAMASKGKYSLTWDTTGDNGKTVGKGAYVISLYIDGNLATSEKVVKKGKGN